MDEVYKPISRQETINALVAKFGGVETVRYFLNNALSDLQTMEVGIADNNPLNAVRTVESLRENLENIRTILEKKENRPSIEGATRQK